MENTPNYNLKKPQTTDLYDVQNFNDNADIIDTTMKTIDDSHMPTESPEYTGELKSGVHYLHEFLLDDGTTRVFKVRRDGESYTLFEIVAPERADGHREATLVLMREQDPDNGGAEFLDLYNMNYPDGKQMGIRIQSRGTGVLRDFVFDFNDGVNGIKESMRIDAATREMNIKESMRLRNDGSQILDFTDAAGNRKGYIGKWTNSMLVVNLLSGASWEVKNDGHLVGYTPTGDYYFYSDASTGYIYFNDMPIVSYTGVPATSTSPGIKGQIANDATHMYICIATNSWKRIAFDTGW